jgi:hypothetical protein
VSSSAKLYLSHRFALHCTYCEQPGRCRRRSRGHSATRPYEPGKGTLSGSRILRGKGFLASLATERPDLLVLDLMPPDRHGFDVCGKLRTRGSPLSALTDDRKFLWGKGLLPQSHRLRVKGQGARVKTVLTPRAKASSNAPERWRRTCRRRRHPGGILPGGAP